MKNILLLLIMFIAFNISAQSEKEAVQKTIEAFFDAFHKQDSTAIKQYFANDVVMQRIATDSTGTNLIRTQEFSKFLKSIASIPETTKFKEVIKGYSIQIDGPMANAWTPYEFWVNDTMHHCGVNSFQLFKDGEQWKIIYLVDTGRTEGCE